MYVLQMQLNKCDQYDVKCWVVFSFLLICRSEFSPYLSASVVDEY